MHIPLIYKHLFCKYFDPRSGYKRQKCKNMETQFSHPLIKINNFRSVHILLIYEHLFYKYFLLWSVSQATNHISEQLSMFSPTTLTTNLNNCPCSSPQLLPQIWTIVPVLPHNTYHKSEQFFLFSPTTLTINLTTKHNDETLLVYNIFHNFFR